MNSRLRHLLRWLVLALAFWLAVRLLGRQLATVDWSSIEIRWPWLFASLAVHVGYVALYAALWVRLAERAGVSLPRRAAWGAYLVSIAGKYLPLRVAGLGYRLWFYQRHGWPLARVGGTLYFETILVLASGAAVAAVSSFGADWRRLGITPAMWVASAGLLVALLWVPRILSWLASSRPNWKWLHEVKGVATTSAYLDLSWRYAGAWLVLGLGLALTVGAIGGEFSWRLWLHATWSYAIAGLAGMLVVFAPAGLGVRDGVLALALAMILSPEMASLSAVAARVVGLMAELGGAAIGSWLLQTPAGSDTSRA